MRRLRAFSCWVPCIGGDPVVQCGIIMAESAGKARYKSFLNYSDCYRDAKITDVRVRRAPRFDNVDFRSGIMPEFVRREALVAKAKP